MEQTTQITPKTGFAGLIQNWQSDLIAAISVALVALPLALGVAYASGVPPMSGIISAIIGGVVTTFLRGSHVAINGPAAGLIAVIISSAVMLNDGSGNTLNYVFAAIVMSGALQVVLGLLRLGRLADVFHSTVINGLLAGIGVIIFTKQIHVALGTTPVSTEIIGTLKEAFYLLPEANPFVLVISIIGLILLIFQSKINYRLFHLIPAPMWVLALSIPIVYMFDFFTAHDIHFMGRDYAVGPHLLIELPKNILSSVGHPNFSKIDTLPFWISVISITLIGSIASLASSKAVDKLDPYKRKTNLNKDLIGIGASTMLAGLIGGLPIITVIVRSTVNVNNHAKTKWSNFFHGIILLLIIFLLSGLLPGMPQIIQKVPLAALAILLVHTGYKLASPTKFAYVYSKGIEQLAIFVGTLVITLYTNLLGGIFGGLLVALTIHFLLAKLPIADFFKSIFKSGSQIIMLKDDSFELRLKGVANFLGTMHIEELLNEIPKGAKATVDLSGTRLVDFSVMEHLHEFKKNHVLRGGQLDITGLDDHISSSPDKLAMKVRIDRPRKADSRQLGLLEMAIERDWEIELKADEEINELEQFYFFQSRVIKTRFNRVNCGNTGVNWEICDLKFEEGALLAADEFQTTVGLIRFPYDIPKFTIEEKGILDRYLIAHKDIDYKVYNNFSEDYMVKVDNVEGMRKFLTPEIQSLMINSGLTHLESDGTGILIFSDGLKVAQLREFAEMVTFLEELRAILSKKSSNRISNFTATIK